MADPIPSGTIQVEDDPQPSAPVVPAPVAPEPVAAVPPVVAAPVEPEEPDAVEVGGEKLVPLAALQAERSKGKALAEKAALADQLQQQWQQAQPYVQFLQNNPQLLQRQQPAPPPQPQRPPQADPDVVAYAQTLSLYKPDGSPDLESAGRLLGIAERRAQRQAQQVMQPMVQQTIQGRSEANFRTVMTNLKDADGRAPTEQNLRAVWNAVGPQATQDPQVAALLGLMAIGADRSIGGVKSPIAPPAQAPLVTEASGGNPRTRPTMSALDETIARERGMTHQKFQDLAKGFVAGRPNVLESD